MLLIDIYDKYILTTNDKSLPTSIPYYNLSSDIMKTTIFSKAIYNNIFNLFDLNKIISSKNNLFNIPYSYIIDYLLKENKIYNYILTVPYDVNRFEMKCLTNINNNVIPVYEYIIDSCIYVEEKLVNNEQIKNEYLIYYNRYNTYKVKVTVNNFNVSCEVVDTINYGTDWLMNELTTFIYSHTNIPKDMWNNFIENNISLLYEFLYCDDEFEYSFEGDNDYINIKFDITINDFKNYISDYMKFVDGCVVRSNDMFKMLFSVDNQFDLKNHINNFIKDSFKCDIIYYNFSKINHKMIQLDIP